MSKVKQKVEDQPIEETVVGFKPPMSKVKLNIVAIGIAAYLHLTKCFKPPMSKVKHKIFLFLILSKRKECDLFQTSNE